MVPVRLIAYSDYLCPWCYVAAVRLGRIEAEFGDYVEVEWRSFLLRPRPDPGRTLEKFVRYTQSWQRPAEEEPSAEFRVWSTQEGPPSHSIPPHLVAKVAATLGDDAFRAVHQRLLRAYFSENRDITSAATLHAVWTEAGLPEAELARVGDPAVLRLVLEQHNEAVELGVGGVPAVRAADSDVAITGAQPLETYRRWVGKLLAA
jgi:predicted DsbA family dithiol-disulfide isomerase